MYILLHEDRTVTTTDKEPKLDAMEWPQIIKVETTLKQLYFVTSILHPSSLNPEYDVKVLVPGDNWVEVENDV